jgi:hypothetical protein
VILNVIVKSGVTDHPVHEEKYLEEQVEAHVIIVVIKIGIIRDIIVGFLNILVFCWFLAIFGAR